jgi:exopolysaccharide production protein ExoY
MSLGHVGGLMATGTRDTSLLRREPAPDVVPVAVLPTLGEVEADQGFYARFGKRALDVGLAVLLLVVLSPLIAVAAMAIVLTSGWPAFYTAQRVGRDGRLFRMWKLRTMKRNADQELIRWRTDQPELFKSYSRDQKLREDPRVTLLGRLLRRSSVDELPQLWNVIKADMSLVGPRPYMPHELDTAYAAYIYIVSVRPGLTGPWQITGRNSIGPVERKAIDALYSTTVSLGDDLKLLVMTAPLLVRWNGL